MPKLVHRFWMTMHFSNRLNHKKIIHILKVTRMAFKIVKILMIIIIAQTHLTIRRHHTFIPILTRLKWMRITQIVSTMLNLSVKTKLSWRSERIRWILLLYIGPLSTAFVIEMRGVPYEAGRRDIFDVKLSKSVYSILNWMNSI